LKEGAVLGSGTAKKTGRKWDLRGGGGGKVESDKKAVQGALHSNVLRGRGKVTSPKPNLRGIFPLASAGKGGRKRQRDRKAGG